MIYVFYQIQFQHRRNTILVMKFNYNVLNFELSLSSNHQLLNTEIKLIYIIMMLAIFAFFLYFSV